MPSGQGRTPARAKALIGAGGIAWWQGDLPAARSLYEEALAIERELGDPARIAEALYNRVFVFVAEGDIEAAVRLRDENLHLFRRAGDEHGEARVLWWLSLWDVIPGDLAPLIARGEQAVAIWRRLGDRFHLADGLNSLAVAYARVGRGAEARSAALEALELFGEADNPTGIATVILGLSFVARWEGRYEDAVRLAAASESLGQRAGGGAPFDFVTSVAGDPEAEARAHVSEDAARRAWEEGRTMSVDEAVALAVK
jgi:tetratricopeptide (TPR) repeat protein